MSIPPHLFAIVIGGMAITLIVMPKNRPAGYLLYGLLAAYIMLQMIDPATVVTVPTIAIASDAATLVPVAAVTALLVAIAIVLGGERAKK